MTTNAAEAEAEKERLHAKARRIAAECWTKATESPEQIERHKRLCIHMTCVLMMWVLAVMTGVSFLDMIASISPITMQEIGDYILRA